MKRTHQIALIIDMRSYQNQVTSLTMFTSNYLLFIFNLLSSHRFYLKYPQNISYHHSTSPSGWAEEWMKLSSIDSSSSNLKLDSVQATIEDMRYEMTQTQVPVFSEGATLCSRKYDKVDIFYSKSSKYVLCQFQYD